MTKVETETVQMITALRDGLHGLHLSRMALVAESRALRLSGRKAERERVWSRVEEITAQIETTNRELAEHMLKEENAQRSTLNAQRSTSGAPERLTDEVIAYWAKRHDLGRTLGELRDMVEDAASLHMLPKSGEVARV